MCENLERREHKRYYLRDGNFAGVYPNIGEVVDISLGGILFNYMDFSSEETERGDFIICGDDGCCLDELTGRVISDKSINMESSFSRIFTRQRRMMFDGLSEEQQCLLKIFIENHKLG